MLIAVLDANVLIPNALCDLLLRLAEEELYVPKWSAELLDEVRRNFPGDEAAAQRRITCMTTAFEEAMVDGHEHLIPQMTNHPKDRHVLAAAVHIDADRVVTRNMKDFPRSACEPYGVEPERPDDFLLGMLAREESVLLRVIGEQAADTGRRGRGLSIPDVLDYLAKAGAPRFSTAVSNLTGEWMEQVRTVPLPRGTVRNCSSYDQPLTAPATTPRAK